MSVIFLPPGIPTWAERLPGWRPFGLQSRASLRDIDGEIGLTPADYHRALPILGCADPALAGGSLGR